jgi:hypothetical protein
MTIECSGQKCPTQTFSIITKLLIGQTADDLPAEGYNFERRGRITPLITGLVPTLTTF